MLRARVTTALDALRRHRLSRRRVILPCGDRTRQGQRRRILVLGVYLADRANTVTHLVDALGDSDNCEVTQRWVALNGEPPTAAVASVTAMRPTELRPKMRLINELLAGARLESYDYVFVTDDDVVVPLGFLDAFIASQERCDFALAQPARTANSWIDHDIVRQVPGLLARRTRFVEIGPMFSVRADLAPFLLPFDERSPMGWGLDFVWPAIVERHGFRMGIIDAVPMDHSLRRPKSGYKQKNEHEAMGALLAQVEHVVQQDAQVTLERIRLDVQQPVV